MNKLKNQLFYTIIILLTSHLPISCMENTQGLNQFEIWITNTTKVIGIIWPNSTIHKHTTVDEENNPIVETTSILPRTTKLAILEITKGHFEPRYKKKLQKTKKHILSRINHIIERGYNKISINSNTFGKLEKLGLVSLFNFSYSDENQRIYLMSLKKETTFRQKKLLNKKQKIYNYKS